MTAGTLTLLKLLYGIQEELEKPHSLLKYSMNAES